MKEWLEKIWNEFWTWLFMKIVEPIKEIAEEPFEKLN